MNSSSSGSPRNVIIVAASCLIGFLNFGTARLSGLLFVACRERFSTGRKEASLPFILSYTVRNLSGPIVGYLGDKFGLQLIILSGCLLSAVAVGGCFFVEDIISFTVLWGGCFGIAFGMGTTLIPNVLHLHFKKSFNRIYGMVQAGGCMGSLVLPGVVDTLLKSYGTSGAMLILSGLILHCVPAAMLLRKLARPWIVKSRSKTIEINETQRDVKMVETKYFENSVISNDEYRDVTNISDISPGKYTEKLDMVKRMELKTDLISEETNKLDFCQRNSTESQNLESSILSGAHKVEKLGDDGINKSILPPESVLHQTSHLAKFQEIESGTEKLGDSTIIQSSLPRNTDLTQTTVIYKSKDCSPEIVRIAFDSSIQSLGENKLVVLTEEEGQKKHVKTQSTSKSKNFKIFIDPAYILILLSLGVSLVVLTAMYTVIVDVCRDKGIAEDVTVLMTFAITDMLGRFSFGYIADSRCISQLNIFVLCYGCCGILMIGFAWVNDFYVVLIFVAGFGTFMGGIIVLPVGMIANYIKKDNLTMAVSSRYFLFALLSFSESPVIGYFRETLKSYDGLLYLLGSMCFLGTIITLLIPSAAKWRDNRKEKKIKKFLK